MHWVHREIRVRRVRKGHQTRVDQVRQEYKVQQGQQVLKVQQVHRVLKDLQVRQA